MNDPGNCDSRCASSSRPEIFSDARGAFWETYNERLMQRGRPAHGVEAGQHLRLEQECSARHSLPDHAAAGKAGARTYGAVFDVAVDLRRSSAPSANM